MHAALLLGACCCCCCFFFLPARTQPPYTHSTAGAEDHSTATRAITAWKFAAAAAARAANGARLPLSPPASWPPSGVHIGLHYRVNDGKLVPEAALARILREYVLPPLSDALPAGTPLLLHIFSEAADAGAELPELMALHGAQLRHGGALSVHYSGAEVAPLEALWALSQCDVFVGSVSSFSWVVAQFSSRPAALLQDWSSAGEYKWCLAGAGCCDQAGACDGAARLLMAETAERLARMAGCGQLNEASWRDEARVGAPNETVHG